MIVSGAMSAVNAPDVAKPIGPYSHSFRSGNLIFISGQIALTPDGTFDAGSVDAQMTLALTNLERVLAANGCGKSRVVKTTLFLTTMDHFGIVNPIYERFFESHRPARSTIAVAGLPKGALVEIEAVAEAQV